MRCFIGFVMFLVLYLGSLQLLREGVAATVLRNGQAYSQAQAEQLGAEAVTKYHPIFMVGAGAVSILICSIPTLLMKLSQRDVEWQ